MVKDEIVFIVHYKGLEEERYYDLQNRKPSDVSYILSEISKKIEEKAYVFAPVDTEKIRGFIRDIGPSTPKEMAKISQKRIKEVLLDSVKGNKDLLPASESALFSILFQHFGIKKLPEIKGTIKSQKPDEDFPRDVITFIGHYDKWAVIKKMSLDSKTKDYQVSAILSGINYTALNKSWDFYLSDKEKRDDEAAKLVKGKRKSLTVAFELMEELKDSYILIKALEKLGYFAYATPFMLTKAYPDIKPPKIKGRKPKG